jgi:hypothetical protein
MARSKILLLESNAFLSCVSCEFLHAEINELNLTHTTCVDELEHARAEICDNVDALLYVNDVACSCDFICISCIDLESEALSLKKMHEDMSTKLVEHDDMSANLEKENELLRTTYAKCIEEEINN